MFNWRSLTTAIFFDGGGGVGGGVIFCYFDVWVIKKQAFFVSLSMCFFGIHRFAWHNMVGI